ncbi:MAG: hypothetical protein ACEQSR_11110 [Candidatus Methylacidiphilales bacterium]
MNIFTRDEDNASPFHCYNGTFIYLKHVHHSKVRNALGKLAHDTIFLLEYLYFVVIVLLIVFLMIEFKIAYKIDILPYIDTPF